MQEMIKVEKEVYEAVLRNSVRVIDLEVENQQLKFLLKECRYKIIADLDNARLCESSVDIEDFEYLLNRIDNAIGEKR